MSAENRGFRRVMRETSQEEGTQIIRKEMDERQTRVSKLLEFYKNTRGLGFEKGKLEEMYNKDPHKTANMLLYLNATEQGAYSNPEVAKTVEQKKLMETSRLREDAQTSGFLGITPQDIVKVARIAYPNSVAPDIFDFWGMSSMKDTLYKLETKTGYSYRGADSSVPIYENYNDGRYTSEISQDTITAAVQTVFTGTLAQHPIRPFTVRLYVNGEQVATDDGAGNLTGPATGVGAPITPGTGSVVDYTSGVYSVTFAGNRATTDTIYIQSNLDSEQSSLYTQVGNVLLNLVAYDYRAVPWPLAIEWTRFTEELMQSKINLSAKEMLIAGGADAFRKNIDSICIDRGIKATTWTTPVSFDTDFAAAGSDSSKIHAQGLLQALMNAELKTYGALGRYADKTNIVVDQYTYAYMTKHDLWNPVNSPSKVGVFQVGTLNNYNVYLAPYGLLPDVRSSNQGNAYLFGKGQDGLSVDSVISVGTWKAGLTTNPVELKNFNSQMGLMMLADLRTNNRQFSSKVTLQNLTANS